MLRTLSSMATKQLLSELAAGYGRDVAIESVGGVEYYLIEQEGSRFPEIETARKCLETWRRLRA